MKKSILFALILMLTLTSCAGHKNPEYKSACVLRDTIQGTPCCIYLPQSGQATYPVLYLQHGMWGNENDWVVKGRIVPIMDSLLQLGLVREMVIVMPDNCPGRPTYEEERDNGMSGEWVSGFADFMAEVESKYPVSNQPSQRAIAGLSMGGFHTMHISHHLSGQFAYVGLFSPATIPAPKNPIYDNWEDEVREQMTYDPLYWIGIGNEDFLYDHVAEYRKWLNANHIEYTYYESAGGHDWPNWQDYITRFLQRLNGKIESAK